MTLICGGWSDWAHFHFIMPGMPDKQRYEHSAALCTALPGKPLFYSSKPAPSGKEMNLHFHSDLSEKTNKWVGNMLMFHVDINMKQLGTRFKNDSFQ